MTVKLARLANERVEDKTPRHFAGVFSPNAGVIAALQASMFSLMRNGLSGQIHLPLPWLNTAMNDIARKFWEEPRAIVLFFAQPATFKSLSFLALVR